MSIASQGGIHKPWYREPWPWLLMAGPVAVVIAGVFTAWLAIRHEDALVADDYYKQGLAINKVIRRDAEAAALHLHARVLFGDDRVRVLLRGAVAQSLILQLVHPTRSGLDRAIRLASIGDGWYEGSMQAVREGRWRVLLEDSAATWRLTGEWKARAGQSLSLDAGRTDGAGR